MGLRVIQINYSCLPCLLSREQRYCSNQQYDEPFLERNNIEQISSVIKPEVEKKSKKKKLRLIYARKARN